MAGVSSLKGARGSSGLVSFAKGGKTVSPLLAGADSGIKEDLFKGSDNSSSSSSSPQGEAHPELLFASPRSSRSSLSRLSLSRLP